MFRIDSARYKKNLKSFPKRVRISILSILGFLMICAILNTNHNIMVEAREAIGLNAKDNEKYEEWVDMYTYKFSEQEEYVYEAMMDDFTFDPHAEVKYMSELVEEANRYPESDLGRYKDEHKELLSYVSSMLIYANLELKSMIDYGTLSEFEKEEAHKRYIEDPWLVDFNNSFEETDAHLFFDHQDY